PICGRMILSRMAIGPSVTENPQIKMVKALGIGHHVNCDYPPAPDRECQYDAQSAMGGHDDSRGSVNKRHLCEPRTTRAGERLFGYQRRTAVLPRCASRDRRAVGTEHDLVVEHSQ